MVRLLILVAGLGAQVFVFGLLLLYIVPFFCVVGSVISFREGLSGLISKTNIAAAKQDLKDGFWFAVVAFFTFVVVYNRKVIWQWLTQFI